MPLHGVGGSFADEVQSEDEPQFETERAHKEQSSNEQTQSKHHRKQEVLRRYLKKELERLLAHTVTSNALAHSFGNY